MEPKQIEDMIKALTEQRDEFVAQVNREIAFLNGKIAMLAELLAQPAQAQEVRESENGAVLEAVPE